MGIFPLPIEPDSSLRLRVQSSKTNRIVLDALVQRGRRRPELIELINVTPDGDRSVDTKEEPIPGDTLWGLTIREPTGTLRRGQTFVRGDLISPQGGSTIQALASGYVHGEKVVPQLHYESPTDGQGDVQPNQILDDEDGDNDLSNPLALTNSIRRIDEIAIYYHCSGDVATRDFNVEIRQRAPTVPTGFDAGADRNIFLQAGPTLTANQDGIFFAKSGYTAVVDEGVITLSDNTTVPNPFPLWINQSNDGTLIVDIANGETADKYDVWAFGEIWFE